MHKIGNTLGSILQVVNTKLGVGGVDTFYNHISGTFHSHESNLEVACWHLHFFFLQLHSWFPSLAR